MLKNKKPNIPLPSLSRLLTVYRLLEQLEKDGIASVSSSEIGKILGYKPDSIRKDVSFLGEVGNFGGGYEVQKLKRHISTKLELEKKRKTCIVGLGRLGTAILNYDDLLRNGFIVVAGFDSNINKLETINTALELFPAYEIAEIVRRKEIEIGVIAVPARSAQETADRLMEGGIKGIINFSPVAIEVKNSVMIRNIDLLGECMLLSTLLTFEENALR
ncbi:MAG TPA: redox-sensing transcriptional repressor Rex [Chitinivibrionales bacterium]|nr:redox-sensing transcriptional repressor Rex [Chitinivibrionales bacterium]